MAEKKAKNKIEAKDIPATEPKLEDNGINEKADVKAYVEPINEFSLKEMKISDLMDYRKACIILRDFYGNNAKIANTAIEAEEYNMSFNKYNSILTKVMNEIETRIDKITD